MKLILIFFFCFNLKILMAQASQGAGDCLKQTKINTFKPSYSTFFEIDFYSHFSHVKIKTEKVSDDFIVTSKKLNCMSSKLIISSDIKKVIMSSTTHLEVLKQLKKENLLIAFAGKNYIFSNLFNLDKIQDLGPVFNPENLVKLNADLVVAYDNNLKNPDALKLIRSLGVPLVLNFDYQEGHPLARAEWNILMSLFLGNFKAGKDQFSVIEKKYNEIKAAAALKSQKMILLGHIQSGRWASAGGKSDLGILVKDAGGVLYLDNTERNTQFFSIESVLGKTQKIDYWLPQNLWNSKNEITTDKRYYNFKEIQTYNNNKRINKFGYNDYWEEGIARPDLLLEDLVSIFHGEGQSLRWYQKIN